MEVLDTMDVDERKVVILFNAKSGKEDGVSLFDALHRLAEFNKHFGVSARLIGHKTAEILLSRGKHNCDLEPYSPFWTGTTIAYESRRTDTLNKTIRSYHHPKDGRLLHTAQFPTHEFCGDKNCALTVEGLKLEDFEFGADHTITINTKSQTVKKTDGFPQHPEQLFQDAETGVPTKNASRGRKLWLIRADRPVLWGGGLESEAVNPHYDNCVSQVVRSAPLPSRSRLDESFIANTDFFQKYGVLFEIDEEEFVKIK